MNKIIVADDVHDRHDSLALLSRLTGDATRTACNGLQAVAAANVERPDVVVLALSMPLVDGFQAARAIRDRYPSPPPMLVAVSALSADSVKQRVDALPDDAGRRREVAVDRRRSGPLNGGRRCVALGQARMPGGSTDTRR